MRRDRVRPTRTACDLLVALLADAVALGVRGVLRRTTVVAFGAATVGFGAATVGAAVVVDAGAWDVVTGSAVVVADVVVAAGFFGLAL